MITPNDHFAINRRKRIILHELFVSDKTMTYSCLSFNYLDTLSITSSKYVQTEIHIKFYETSFKLVLCNLSLLSLIRSISCYSNMHLFIENDGTLIPYNVLREHCPLICILTMICHQLPDDFFTQYFFPFIQT